MKSSKWSPRKRRPPPSEMAIDVIPPLGQPRQTETPVKETCPLDSSRFITTSDERFDTLTLRHQTTVTHGQAHSWLVPEQNVPDITRTDRGWPSFKCQLSTFITSNGSDSEYQSLGNGKSPVSTIAATLSTAQTSPLLTGVSDNEEKLVGADLEPLQCTTQHQHEIPTRRVRDATEDPVINLKLIHRSKSRTFPPCSNSPLREDTVNHGRSQIKRQNEALQGFGDWADEDNDEDNSEDKLGSRLYMALESPPSASVGFMPRDKLLELVNPKTVLEELDRALLHTLSREQIGKYRDMICNDSDAHNGEMEENSIRKTFAILSLVDKIAALPAFIRERVTDGDLPFVTEKSGNELKILRKKGSSGKPLTCFRGWEPQKKADFVRYQWSMLAPIFREGGYNRVPHEVIHHHDQLPFIRPDNPIEASEYSSDECVGGGGKVTMVNIHPAHHTFSDKTLSKRGFAIKVLHTTKHELFKRERTILGKFIGTKRHENIVTLLATYELTNEHTLEPTDERTSKFGLIFYRADGNLYDHWKKTNPSPKFNYENILWTSTQCRGLTDGLLQLHRHTTWSRIPPRPSGQTAKADESGKISQYGRHGDMKPENILCYPRPDSDNPTLVICDFGTSELRFRMTGSVHDEPFTDTYRAPELDIEGRSPSQSGDIWSLGCVFLEHVAWLLGGICLVETFMRTRISWDARLHMDADTFFYCHEDGDRMVKEKVTEFIHACHSNAKCTQYLHDFLDIIERKMLVIDLQGREVCDRLAMDLRRILEDCQSNEDYATKAAPWPAKANKVIPASRTAEKNSHIRRAKYAPRGISGMEVLKGSNLLENDPTSSWEDRHSTK